MPNGYPRDKFFYPTLTLMIDTYIISYAGHFSVEIYSTVKPVLSGHSKIDKTNILMTNGSLMMVESIAECSPWSILQYF